MLQLSVDNVLNSNFNAKKYFSSNVIEAGKTVLCCGFQMEISEDLDIGCNEMKKYIHIDFLSSYFAMNFDNK